MTVEFGPTVKGHFEGLAHRGDMRVPEQILASIAKLVNTAMDCAATGAFHSTVDRVAVTLWMVHWVLALGHCRRQHCGRCLEQVAPGSPVARSAVAWWFGVTTFR
jgi:hypothetical protein